MGYKFIYTYQHSKVCGDNKRRNFLLFFLNDVLILKQKMPFDETYDHGHQNRTWITDIYLLNGNIHQKRQAKENNGKLREVKYPISKKLLEQFNIPKDTKITLQNG